MSKPIAARGRRLGHRLGRWHRGKNSAEPWLPRTEPEPLGRLTADVATAVPDHNVVSLILRLGYSFNPAGLPYQQTSYSDVSGLTVANQVQDAYNGYGQLTTQYQAHSGAVVVGSTPEVQYQYAQPSGANYSRLAAMIYPNGKQLDYNYTTTLDSAIRQSSGVNGQSSGVNAALLTTWGWTIRGQLRVDHPGSTPHS